MKIAHDFFFEQDNFSIFDIDLNYRLNKGDFINQDFFLSLECTVENKLSQEKLTILIKEKNIVYFEVKNIFIGCDYIIGCDLIAVYKNN